MLEWDGYGEWRKKLPIFQKFVNILAFKMLSFCILPQEDSLQQLGKSWGYYLAVPFECTKSWIELGLQKTER